LSLRVKELARAPAGTVMVVIPFGVGVGKTTSSAASGAWPALQFVGVAQRAVVPCQVFVAACAWIEMRKAREKSKTNFNAVKFDGGKLHPSAQESIRRLTPGHKYRKVMARFPHSRTYFRYFRIAIR
jgi:hypothetical protein